MTVVAVVAMLCGIIATFIDTESHAFWLCGIIAEDHRYAV